MTYSSEVLADSPLAYYRLAEASGTTMVDSSGNGRDGTYSGTYTLNQPSLLALDANASINFTNGRGLVASPTWLNGSQNITVEAMIQPTATSMSSTRTIARHDQDASPITETGFGFRLNAGKPEVFLTNAAGTTQTLFTAPNALIAGKKYHVAFTFDGTNIHIYVNKIRVLSSTFAGRYTGSTQDLRIGSAASAQNYDGVIDEVAIYGSALSWARIRTHYNEAFGISSTPDLYSTEVLADSPWGFWPCEEETTAAAIFEPANGRHMALVGSPVSGLAGPRSKKAVRFPSSVGSEHYAETSETITTSPVTVEAWVYLTALPTALTPIVACGASYGNDVHDKVLRITATGKVEWMVYTSTNVNITTLKSLPLNTWCHIVASTGASGSRVRVNKEEWATGAVTTSYTGAAQKVFLHGAGSNAGGVNVDGGVITISNAAIYTAQLSNARTDAHYDVMIPSPTSYSTTILSDTPLAYYRLGETSGTTVVDSSGNARNGSYSGSMTLGYCGIACPEGKADPGADFIGGHVAVPDAAWLNLASFTAEAWIRPDTATGDRPIVTHTSWTGASGAASRGWHLALIGERINVGLRFTDSTFHDAAVGPKLYVGVIYHVALTWDGTTVRLFIDGAEVWSSTAYSGKTLGNAATSLRIGASSLDGDSSFAAFDGIIDEVAIYGSALTAARLKEHFRAGVPTNYDSLVTGSIPLVYWKMDEKFDGTVQDATAQGRTGTVFNGATPGQPSLLPNVPDGQAIDLNGPTAQAVFRSTEAWMNVTTGITVEGWFKIDGDAGSSSLTHTLIAKDSYDVAFSSRAWRLVHEDSLDMLRWSAFYTSSARFVVDAPVGLIDRNVTYHIVGTYDGLVARLYVNGVEVGSQTVAGSLRTSGYALQVGKDSTSGNKYAATAQADEFSMLGHALTAGQVLARYEAATVSAPTVPVELWGDAASDANATASLTLANISGSGSASAESSADATASTVASGEVNNREGGRWRQAIGYAEWVPAVVPIEGTLVVNEDVAFAYSVPAVDPDNGRVSYAAVKTSATRHRDRLVVGNKDITSWRGVMTPLPNYSLVEPLGYGPATLVLPQVVAAFEEPGVGDLSFLKPGARVLIQRVDDEGNIVATDYRGVLIAFAIDGPDLTCTVGGEASGRAALREKQVPIFFWRKDLGRYAHDAIRSLRLPFEPYLGPDTGIEVMRFGGLGYLDFLQQLCAMGTTRTGKQWTIMPNWETGKYEMFRKDTTTIRGTVYNDDTRTPVSLSRDIAEEPNRIYATGVTPEGLRVRFGRYPGLKQTPAPPYPMNDNSSFGQGTTDGDTDTGDGITILVNRLFITKYLGREALPGGYDADVTRAVKDLQKDAGLNRTGNMNPKTWAALYDLTTTGFSLRGSHIGPAAEDPKVRPWNLSGSGGKMSRNPSFDRNVLPVDRNVDVGTGFDRGQIREWSETELEDSQSAPNWTGSITFNTNALVAGTHTPGDPLEEADLLRARDLRAGDNLWLPLFAGGITVHVSAVQVSANGVVSVDVDTRARDSLEVWEVIARNREARRSLRREWIRENRSSTQTKDSTAPWDEVGGILYDKVALEGGKWNVFPVVAGQEGIIQRLRVRTNPNAEYVMAVFGRRIYPSRLRKLIGNPLTATGNRKWQKESVRDALDASNVLLYVAGSDKQPCGYFPKKKTGRNDADTGAAPLTGRWEDDSTFPYRCFPATVLWVAVWADRDTTIPQGRIMWPQLEAGT